MIYQDILSGKVADPTVEELQEGWRGLDHLESKLLHQLQEMQLKETKAKQEAYDRLLIEGVDKASVETKDMAAVRSEVADLQAKVEAARRSKSRFVDQAMDRTLRDAADRLEQIKIEEPERNENEKKIRAQFIKALGIAGGLLDCLRGQNHTRNGLEWNVHDFHEGEWAAFDKVRLEEYGKHPDVCFQRQIHRSDMDKSNRALRTERGRLRESILNSFDPNRSQRLAQAELDRQRREAYPDRLEEAQAAANIGHFEQLNNLEGAKS